MALRNHARNRRERPVAHAMMSFSLNKLHYEVKLHSTKQSLSSHGLYWVRKERFVSRSQPRGTLHNPRPDLDDAVPQ